MSLQSVLSCHVLIFVGFRYLWPLCFLEGFEQLKLSLVRQGGLTLPSPVLWTLVGTFANVMKNSILLLPACFSTCDEHLFICAAHTVDGTCRSHTARGNSAFSLVWPSNLPPLLGIQWPHPAFSLGVSSSLQSMTLCSLS